MAADPDPRVNSVETRIEMDDGITLAATIYLPDESRGPQPCIIEALPYRKDDLTSSYSPEYVRLAGEYGYVVCRLDLRGTGSSGGDATDEYPEQEQRDLAVAMRWLAAQPWCDGNIGMYGTSYSGFNSLQMACERPPELKAIVAIFATDDRYTDDVHYRGGAVKFSDLLDYNHYVAPMNALPPVPVLWGETWREEWLRRLAVNEPWLLTWMREQRDGPYWRHGSVRPDYDRIACPTMIVAGWADGYRNATFRLVERLRANGVPHRLLAGPWAHLATESSAPGPRIDLVPEMVTWWDRWLRNVDNGVDDGLDRTPCGSIFVRTSTRPAPALDTSNGYWVREEWPTPRSSAHTIDLDSRDPYPVNPAVGTSAWIDCAGHLPWGQSSDQRLDDALSLRWETRPPADPIIGHPIATLRVSSDKPVAYLSAKLCDVFADGTSALVARGSLNLTHRDGSTDPKPLIPNQVYEIKLELEACAYQFDAGQTLRLSVAGSDWPNTSAPPESVTLTIHGGSLELPTWQGPSPYEAPTFVDGDEVSGEDPTGVTWVIERDVLAQTTRCLIDHGSSYDAPYGARVTERYTGDVSVDESSFVQFANAHTRWHIEWPEATVETRATLKLEATATHYNIVIDLEAREGEELVADRHWQEQIPRDLA